MGSYNRWYVDVNLDNGVGHAELIENIKKTGRELDIDKSDFSWDSYCFRKWSETTKWSPTDIVSALSKKFPEVFFSIKYNGDYGSGTDFYKNGVELPECFVFPKPRFPSRPEWKAALKRKEAYDLKKKQEYQTAQLKKAQEEAEKFKKLAEQKENELKALQQSA